MDDTKYISDLVTDFGSLPKKLLITLLNKQNPETAERLIRKLRNENRIVPVLDIFLAANRFCKPDIRSITALWIAAKFLTEAEPARIYPCRFPSVLAFIRNGEIYEVLVLYEEETQMLAASDADKNTKYIIVVPDPSSVSHLERFGGVRYILATAKYSSMDEEPEIIFYRRDNE